MFSSSVSPFTGPSRLSTLIGVSMEKSNSVPAASSNTIDAEARREAPAVFLESPPAVYTVYHDQQGAAHSLEDHRLSCDTSSVPPPYSPESYIGTTTEKHTEVSSDEEPPTLARMLFIYGFLFFPFWLAGIYILYAPLLPTPDWEAGKPEEEKSQQLQLLRKTELKWAYRCLWAMLGLLVTVFLLVVIIKFGIMKPL